MVDAAIYASHVVTEQRDMAPFAAAYQAALPARLEGLGPSSGLPFEQRLAYETILDLARVQAANLARYLYGDTMPRRALLDTMIQHPPILGIEQQVARLALLMPDVLRKEQTISGSGICWLVREWERKGKFPEWPLNIAGMRSWAEERRQRRAELAAVAAARSAFDVAEHF